MRMRTTLLALIGLFSLSACAIKDEVDDGLWEIRAKVSRAELTITDASNGTVDFTFVYLLGLVDDEGVTGVEWRYALVDPDRDEGDRELASTTQLMRQPQEEAREIFVQGERPRELVIENTPLDPVKTYVLWIEVLYRDATLTEVLIPIKSGEVYLNDAAYGDIPQLSTR